MVIFTGLLFIVIGLWFMLNPTMVEKFDGVSKIVSNNIYYYKYIKIVGLAFIISGIVCIISKFFLY